LALRFDFGRNWKDFAEAKMDTRRLTAARNSLWELIGRERLRGRTLVDVGCGSGLFSIAAAQSGVARVVGFDVNPTAVQVSRDSLSRLRGALAPCVEPEFLTGSILDRAFVAGLGRFDVVYAWGVLHHTGAMWEAIRSAAGLADEENGILVVAIYNRHWTSPLWGRVKRLYNRAPPAGRWLLNRVFAPAIYAGVWLTTGQNPLRKERGMDFWYDVVDWLGGYPYEYAGPQEVVDFVQPLGFAVERIKRPRGWTGCNEFVFTRGSAPVSTTALAS
jgi:2-polyprenyl-6-hydroxyphenyl methylase/3-demethylubiquinone-9 3-methyltransferase